MGFKFFWRWFMVICMTDILVVSFLNTFQERELNALSGIKIDGSFCRLNPLERLSFLWKLPEILLLSIISRTDPAICTAVVAQCNGR
jgi:hypothetical protein